MKRHLHRRMHDSGEFLWLMSLSDLMILLFLLFAVLFSFSYKKMKQSDLQQIVAVLKNEKPPPNPIEEIKKGLETWAKDEKLEKWVEVKTTENSVLLEIKDQVLFSSGEYWIHPQGRKTLHVLSKAIQRVPPAYQIGIEGHTDDIPIYTDEIEDNWELSAKRALSVLSAMELPSEMLKRVSAVAHGDTIPLVPNRNGDGSANPENQSKNRRVTIRVF